MTHVEPGSENALEELYVAWLAEGATPASSSPRLWAEQRGPAELVDGFCELVELCDRHLPAAKDDLRPGRVLGGDFELIEPLGQGGFGWVWKARQLSLDRSVALKLSWPERVSEARAEAFLQREGQHLAAVDHPGIVAVHTLGRDGPLLFLAMEFVEGPSLARLLDARSRDAQVPDRAGPWAWDLGCARGDDTAVELARALAAAVADLHAQGLHHRDLKPSNVLLGMDGRPRVADFGLSVLRGEDGQGVSWGTPDYLPPEDLHTGSSSDPGRSDTWALAAILYELLTLERPYGREVRGNAPRVRPATELRPDLHPELAALLDQALDPDPNRRHSGPAELERDLVRFQVGEPVAASTAGALRRGRMWIRRRRRFGVPAAALLLLLLGVAWWSPASSAVPEVARVWFEVVDAPLMDGVPRDVEELKLAPAGERFDPRASIDRLLEVNSAFFLRVEAAQPVYLYVLNRGSTGRVTTNFPQGHPGMPSNPLPAGNSRVPLGLVGGVAGEDTFLVVVSPGELAALRDLLEDSSSIAVADLQRSLAPLQSTGNRDVRLPGDGGGSSSLLPRRSDDWFWRAPLDEMRAEFGPGVLRWTFRHR
jgi:Protein kinase domain